MSTAFNPFTSLHRGGTAAAFDPPGAGTAAPLSFHAVEDVARTLGVSPRTIHRRIRDGVIRKVAMGGRLVRISSAELRRLAADAPFRSAGLTDEVSMSYQILGEGE
jgi:excisionase family DNA binding protein